MASTARPCRVLIAKGTRGDWRVMQFVCGVCSSKAARAFCPPTSRTPNNTGLPEPSTSGRADGGGEAATTRLQLVQLPNLATGERASKGEGRGG
jgi:hypothetical protein